MRDGIFVREADPAQQRWINQRKVVVSSNVNSGKHCPEVVDTPTLSRLPHQDYLGASFVNLAIVWRVVRRGDFAYAHLLACTVAAG